MTTERDDALSWLGGQLRKAEAKCLRLTEALESIRRLVKTPPQSFSDRVILDVVDAALAAEVGR